MLSNKVNLKKKKDLSKTHLVQMCCIFFYQKSFSLSFYDSKKKHNLEIFSSYKCMFIHTTKVLLFLADSNKLLEIFSHIWEDFSQDLQFSEFFFFKVRSVYVLVSHLL